MNFRVEYLFDGEDSRSECWTFLSLLPGLEGATALARDGLEDVRESFGAKGFRILDMAGNVVREEFPEDSTPPLIVRSDASNVAAF